MLSLCSAPTLLLLAISAATTTTASPVNPIPIPIPIHTRTSCADVVVHYARGTTEAVPIGGVIGQTFNTTLASALSATSPSLSLSFEGVDYSASIAGFLEGGDPAGSTTLANSVVATAAACPDTQIVMAGYSQGAQLVHNAAATLSESVQQRVSAVVVFGDPKESSALPDILEARRKTFCHDGDDICAGGIFITSAHTSYASDAPAAVDFVVAHV